MGGAGKESLGTSCTEVEKSDGLVKSSELSKRDSNQLGGSLAKIAENLRYEVTSFKVGSYIQCIKDHAVIGKYMEI